MSDGKIELEEMLGVKVDVVHGSVMPDDLIEIHNLHKLFCDSSLI